MHKKATTRSPLQIIPWVGKAIAKDLNDIGIYEVSDLIDQDPDDLYVRSNHFVGIKQDRCLLYVFRGAVYFAQTKPQDRDPAKLKRRYRKD